MANIPKNVSEKVFNAVERIKQMAGDVKKIDNNAEYDALAKLLSGTTGDGNREYIQGLMVEYENNFPSTEKYKEQKAQEAMMKGLSKQGKKTIDDCLKKFDNTKNLWRGRPTYADTDTSEEAIALKTLYLKKNSGLSADERKYLAQEMEKRGISKEPTEVNRVKLSNKEQIRIGKFANEVRDALEGYTTEKEQKRIADIIMNEINADNVMEFLAEYNYNAVGKSHGFFDQLISELNFPEKGKLANKLSKDLQAHMKKYDNKYSHYAKVLNAAEVNKYNVIDSVVIDSFGTVKGGKRYDANELDKFVFEQVQLKYHYHDFDEGVKYNDIEP